MRTQRPWGNFEIIDTRDTYQIKRLEVSPGKRLSLQSHKFRDEHWHVISGEGTVTLESSSLHVSTGDSVTITKGMKHRVSAGESAPLVFIEIQTGSSFSEEDIIRYEDDFGRS